MDIERKPNSHAILKTLPEDRQEQIAEWCAKPNDRDADGKVICNTGGIEYARSQLKKDGMVVGSETVRVFFAWWRRRRRMRSALDASEHHRELMEKFKPGDAQLAREYGEFILLQMANEEADPDLFKTATVAADMRRRLDLEEESGKTKARQKDAQIAQSAAALKLDREKFEAAMRTKLEAAYAALAEEFKTNPEALRLFREAQALLPKA